MDTVDYTQACRLCLSDRGMKVPIFVDGINNDITDLMLPSKILMCVSIKVVKEDPFPAWICQDCQTKIDNIYEFRRICSNSDAELRKSLSTQRELTALTWTEETPPPATGIQIKQEPADYSNTHVYMKMEEDLEYSLEDISRPHDQYEYPALIQPDGLEIQPTNIYAENLPMPQLCTEAQEQRLCARTPHITLECPMGCHPFTNKAAYSRHQKICKNVLEKQGNRLVCAQCHRKFESPLMLVCHEKLHKKSHVKPREVTFPCVICGITFEQKGELICHQAQYHRGQVNRNVAQQKVFACDKCRLSFIHKGEYILHNAFHHTVSRFKTAKKRC